MSHTFAEPVVVCRPALPFDTPDVLEFTKRIFEGRDYIGDVWQDWLDDPQGLLAVAQYGPHTVGIAKASLISPGQWWLEGLRVDPTFQRLKIGSHLHDYMHAWWLKYGDGMLRLVTSSERVAVHHLCERTGFTKIGEVRGYEAPALAEPLHAFEAVEPEEARDARRFVLLHQTPLSALMDSGWRFSAPDEPALLDQALQHRLFWWRGREALFTYWEDEDDRTLGVGLVACTASLLSDLLLDARRLAAQKSLTSVLWHAPAGGEVQAGLQAAGFTSDWDDWGYLYAKRHPTPQESESDVPAPPSAGRGNSRSSRVIARRA